ncbi:MAG: GNAT family N-acetyltransferase [Roseofilum sp. SBFL]|uniref:GNAT family N-acetyltransferase n=1 Tax=unclassified Roseofilum TaxID=2620099 RepID=UPI001B221C72|nr:MULTISPECIES: GNAT family N-acetyltransferase [unclassified Roseofilum]MBP0012984.1 GNAT family N-acetyltransferase [Roseofilum sp. SID3]MBP0023264.1 GNAT family N-acetyltransferase [Roseofilum sp. SID2]MBP0039357.1 GNAT family N-acetyltransferase [Roseofilum sp. SID1]MBP0044120.1 GNAT family N-acetyltransferase [Roseofilum sp. SBFL]
MQGHQMQDATQNPAKAIANANIVPLKPSDFTMASEYLAAAFSQDPMIGYFLPEETAAKKRALQHFSRSFLNFAQLYGHIYTTADDPKGVAIWLPPEAFHISLPQLWQVLTSGLMISPLYMRWSRIQEFLAFLNMEIQMHDQLSPEPHWYLGMLGVSPKCQGQGIGGMLLQPVLEELDRTKMPCYLETTTPGAVRFYQRHGFEVVHQGMFADRQYWSMKRYPQSLSE